MGLHGVGCLGPAAWESLFGGGGWKVKIEKKNRNSITNKFLSWQNTFGDQTLFFLFAGEVLWALTGDGHLCNLYGLGR